MALRIGIVGASHVGLPTAAVFARFGHQVTVYDSDESKIADLRARKMPFFEPGLEAMMNEGVDQGLINYNDGGRAGGGRCGRGFHLCGHSATDLG